MEAQQDLPFKVSLSEFHRAYQSSRISNKGCECPGGGYLVSGKSKE